MLSQEEKTALIKQYAVHANRLSGSTQHRSQGGSSLAARALEDGRTSPPALELPLQQGYRALSFHHR